VNQMEFSPKALQATARTLAQHRTDKTGQDLLACFSAVMKDVSTREGAVRFGPPDDGPLVADIETPLKEMPEHEHAPATPQADISALVLAAMMSPAPPVDRESREIARPTVANHTIGAEAVDAKSAALERPASPAHSLENPQGVMRTTSEPRRLPEPAQADGRTAMPTATMPQTLVSVSVPVPVQGAAAPLSAVPVRVTLLRHEAGEGGTTRLAFQLRPEGLGMIEVTLAHRNSVTELLVEAATQDGAIAIRDDARALIAAVREALPGTEALVLRVAEGGQTGNALRNDLSPGARHQEHAAAKPGPDPDAQRQRQPQRDDSLPVRQPEGAIPNGDATKGRVLL
jgi:hypothetical protein